MVTGKVSYGYLPPVRDCPACETDVKVKLSDYLSSAETPEGRLQHGRFHSTLRKYGAGPPEERAAVRCAVVLKELYDIDGLLFRYGLGTKDRPPTETLVETAAATTPYERLLKRLEKSRRGRKRPGKETTDGGKEAADEIRGGLAPRSAKQLDLAWGSIKGAEHGK
ncbi:MAG TPA: hypothetical protein VI895_08575 [Bdellovibrionota bacterium]|nr:hypothetical protein [Bdellovibrionota bacterium]